MKIVFVGNPHDQQIAEPKRTAFTDHIQAADLRKQAEVICVDFEKVRDILPITSTPCVFLLFDHLEGDFDPADIAATVTRGKKPRDGGMTK